MEQRLHYIYHCSTLFQSASDFSSTFNVKYFFEIQGGENYTTQDIYPIEERFTQFLMHSHHIAAVCLLALAATALHLDHEAPPNPTDFKAWKAKHHVSYASDSENAYREKIFLKNLAKVAAHNKNKSRTYDMGLNQFSALTQEEFVKTYLGTIVRRGGSSVESVDDLKLGSIDWTTKGAVTPVKDQGQCGSCWAFSAVGALEGLSKLADGTLKRFSQQQLVDCSTSFGNGGCNGGEMIYAYLFIIQNGIVLQSEYPYVAKDETCKQSSGDFQIANYRMAKNCRNLIRALAGRPLAVAVDATNWSPYMSGIFSDCRKFLNHGVVLTGATDSYWHIKNSWGTTWGEAGYIKLARGNTCGICVEPTYPIK